MKKIYRFGITLFFMIVLGFAVLALWYWDALSIMTGNKQITGTVEQVPQADGRELPPLTRAAADWPCWRGAGGDNRIEVKDPPKDLSAGLRRLWEIGYLCQGQASAVWSAPVIQGNRLVVCGRSDTEDRVFCLDPATGTLLWQGSYPAETADSYGSGARATPWIDDDRVYTFGRNGDLVCWQLYDGQVLWHRNVSEAGGIGPKWGYSSSPLVTDSLVIVDAGGEARTVAYDKRTGELRWKCGTGLAGYAALAAMTTAGQPAVLDFYGTGLAAVALADGRELWNLPWPTNYGVNATTPIVSEGLVFITSGYNTGGQLIRADGDRPEILWTNTHIASHHSDPFIIDGAIYGYSGLSMQNKGTFKCLDLASGRELWSTREMGWGTAIRVNDYLLCMDIKGNLFLMNPRPDRFELLSQWEQALGPVRGAAWTKPIVANGRLYLRFKQTLICYAF